MEQTETQLPNTQSSQGPVIRPGGFWLRFMAVIIDGIIVAIPSLIVRVVIYAVVAAVSSGGGSHAAFQVFAWCTSTALGILISLAYHSYFYQSTGSTIGKKIFQLKVVDQATGNLLTFTQVFMREVVGKFLSAFTLLIGYLMAGLRTDKRALHDLVADTKVQEISGL